MSTARTRLAAVTALGVTPFRAHQRVAQRAGAGQSHLVTRSVTPLGTLEQMAFGAVGADRQEDGGRGLEQLAEVGGR